MDQVGTVFADLLLHLADLCGGHLGQRLVDLYKGVKFPYMANAVAKGAGHIAVDLGNDGFGHAAHTLGVVHGGAKGYIAVLVRRRYHHHRHIRAHIILQQVRNLIKMAGGKVASAVGNGVPVTGRGKQTVQMKVPGHFRRRPGAIP